MNGPQSSDSDVKTFVIENVDQHPKDIASVTGKRFGISRQAVNKHIQKLIEDEKLIKEGNTKDAVYKLALIEDKIFSLPIDKSLSEDKEWRNKIAPLIQDLPPNVIGIWHYGFSEMLNNVIDHSEGRQVQVKYGRDAAKVTISISDDGIGIFKKIKTALNLDDARHSVLELAKGKFTTDPQRHSGEGIFFTSRMFDEYSILSGSVCFMHDFQDPEDWISQTEDDYDGTTVIMTLSNSATHNETSIFDRFSTGDDYGFNKTAVPVKLTRYGDDKLVSRSQAKRLLARFDRFKIVYLDFEGVDSVGQAFADEVFRVFNIEHPEVELIPVNTNEAVSKMISRAKSHK